VLCEVTIEISSVFSFVRVGFRFGSIGGQVMLGVNTNLTKQSNVRCTPAPSMEYNEFNFSHAIADVKG
jgi:hypothetical protein